MCSDFLHLHNHNFRKAFFHLSEICRTMHTPSSAFEWWICLLTRFNLLEFAILTYSQLFESPLTTPHMLPKTAQHFVSVNSVFYFFKILFQIFICCCSGIFFPVLTRPMFDDPYYYYFCRYILPPARLSHIPWRRGTILAIRRGTILAIFWRHTLATAPRRQQRSQALKPHLAILHHEFVPGSARVREDWSYNESQFQD